MRIPEFVGGLLVGSSIYVTVLATFFLDSIGGPTGTHTYIELLIPFVGAVVAGVGIGFGMKSDDSSGYGFSFSDMSEHWPALIGGLGLAASLGSLLLLDVSGTPVYGLVYAFISIVLCVFGAIVTILNWQSSPY